MTNYLEYIEFIGKVIVFTKGCEDLEDYAEPGMKARVISIELTEHAEKPENECWLMKVDYTEFEEHNQQFESANYYDGFGKPCLTARQVGLYTKEDRYYLPGYQCNNYFILEESIPFSLFAKKKFQLNLKDAIRVCDALELASTWDKTEIYYELKNWIEEENKKPKME